MIDRNVVFSVLMMVANPVLAGDKVDDIINAMDVKSSVVKKLEQYKSQVSIVMETRVQGANAESESSEDYRHDYEALFDRYLTWQALQSEIKTVFKVVYTEDEINALHEFINTPHGKNLFAKSEHFKEVVREVVGGNSKAFSNDLKLLSQKYELERKVSSIGQVDLNVEDSGSIVKSENPLAIGDVVRFSIATKKGQLIGFLARPGRKTELFERAGFLEGDIVTSANGLQVKDQGSVRKIYQTLKSAMLLNFDVLRDGSVIDVQIDLTNLRAY